MQVAGYGHWPSSSPKQFRLLATRLRTTIAAAFDSHPNVHIAIQIPQRLGSGIDEHQAIEASVRAALASQDGRSSSETYRVSIDTIDVRTPAVAQLLREQVGGVGARLAAEAALGLENDHVMFAVRPYQAVVAFSVRSARPDTVIQSILGRLKNDISRQFTGNLPGVMAVELSDLTGEQLAELGQLESSGLRAMLGELFERRPTLDAIVFVARDRHVVCRNAEYEEYGRVTYVYKRQGMDPERSQLLSAMLSLSGRAAGA